jgi:hypothetical protein
MAGNQRTAPPLLAEPRGGDVPCLALRPREAAQALGISQRLLAVFTADGTIPHLRLGRVVLYGVDSLRGFLREQSTKRSSASDIAEPGHD